MNKKQSAFVNELFLCGFNATEAYQNIYQTKSRDTARANAAKLLAKSNIKEAVAQRVEEHTMSADEALILLADMARSDIAKIMDVGSIGFNLDMQKAKELGLTKLIKKVKQKTTTIMGKRKDDEDKEIHSLEVELYDAQAAIDKILKVHGKYVTKGELDLSVVGDMKVIVEYADSKDNSADPA